MERCLRARLGSARLAMEGKTGEPHRLISSAQCKAVEELVSRDPTLQSISNEGLASLVDLAAAVFWHGDDLETVLKLLEPNRQEGKTRRRPGQHFAPAILSYFLEREWRDTLLKAEVLQSEKVDLIFHRIEALSGRNLSEPCLKFVTRFVL